MIKSLGINTVAHQEEKRWKVSTYLSTSTPLRPFATISYKNFFSCYVGENFEANQYDNIVKESSIA